MAFKQRTPEQNDKTQRVRAMSRALGKTEISEGDFNGSGPGEKVDGAMLRAGVTGTLSRHSTVPPEDIRGLRALRTWSPAISSQFSSQFGTTTPDVLQKVGFYAPNVKEVHLGGGLDSRHMLDYDVPNSTSVGVHEIGHHVDHMAGELTNSDGSVKNLGEAEAKAVTYQNRHTPDNNYNSVYEAVGDGRQPEAAARFTPVDTAHYRANRAAGTMPGESGVPKSDVIRLSRQFNPDYRYDQEDKRADAVAEHLENARF